MAKVPTVNQLQLARPSTALAPASLGSPAEELPGAEILVLAMEPCGLRCVGLELAAPLPLAVVLKVGKRGHRRHSAW